MNNKKIIFELKGLVTMIARNFVNNEEICEHNGLKPTATQIQIINYILENADKEIYQKDLENILNLRRATVSGVLQTMEKNELIKRDTDLHDTRVKKIVLTDKAKVFFENGEKKINEIESAILAGISEKELESFLIIIQKMKENVKNINNKNE